MAGSLSEANLALLCGGAFKSLHTLTFSTADHSRKAVHEALQKLPSLARLIVHGIEFSEAGDDEEASCCLPNLVKFQTEIENFGFILAPKLQYVQCWCFGYKALMSILEHSPDIATISGCKNNTRKPFS